MPCPSSAMSSGRLFLDRVARQHCPSPLHRHAQLKALAIRQPTDYHRTAGRARKCLNRLCQPRGQAQSAHDNVIEFLVTRYEKEILPGDTVYVCFGGQTNPGLHATATVQTSPSAAIAPADWQVHYATSGPHPWDEKAEKPLRVRLKIERRLDPPVARCDIYELPELAGHQFVTAHIGTNFPLTPGQAGAIV